MAIDLEHFERSLHSMADARAVMAKARGYLEAWPDLYKLARKTAGEYLLKHTGKPLDPDRVWWNVFDGAASAPTFTGWRHSGPPKQSMTFTQLLIHRFNDGFQVAPDVLPVYGGFYNRGSGAREYGQHNEVQLEPGKVMGDLWAMDFASLLAQRTERFWHEHGDDFPLLAKVRLLASLDEAVNQGALMPSDRQRLRAWLGVGQGGVTLTQLQMPTPAHAFHIRHYLATGGGHLITLRADDGRTVLYCPGTEWLPRAFANHGDLVHWLSRHLRSREAFDALFRVHQQSGAEAHQQAMSNLLKRFGPAEAPAWPFGVGRRVTGDLFAEMRDWAKTDLAVSHTMAVSNADLRKSLWRGYLGAFLGVFGGFPVLAWPLGLVVLGAGVARLSLDIDAAVRARSVVERTQAVISAVADTVAAVFSIIDVGLGVKALHFQAPPHERLIATRVLEPTDRLNDELESLDGNRIVPEPMTTPGMLDGVSIDDDGSTWIEMNDLTLRVRHSPEAEGWLAVDDDDPYAFLPNTRMQVVTDFMWTPLEVAQPELAVSGQLETAASGFWDTYMQANYESHWEMSQALLERQRETLSTIALPSPSMSNPLLENPRQFRYLLKDGKPFYTWVDEEYFNNDLVAAYTDELTQANGVFRHGVEIDNEMVAYLSDLFDSLEQLPRSEAVRLWRGGSGARATGGGQFRNGELTVGDVLVTTDITSFTENPYALRDFVAPKQVKGLKRVNVFDDTSVVYELIGKGMNSGVPIGPMSLSTAEAEVVFTPGRYLRIESVREVRGEHYHFVRVRLREVDKPDVGTVYDLRTGEPFDRVAYVNRVRHASLVERFFPAAQWP